MNDSPDNKLIYLMGAGRSGTTALATFLGNAPQIVTLGEMHPLFEYLSKEVPCSCGAQFIECPFWQEIVENLPENTLQDIEASAEIVKNVEAHRKIFNHVFKGRNFNDSGAYLPLMDCLLTQCHMAGKGAAILDSAKYISRALALRHIDRQDLKILYMVRDVRGVVHSFAKTVQTSRGTLSALLYYTTVNLMAEFVRLTVLRNHVLKIRYEDMMEHPDIFFKKVEAFLAIDLSDVRAKIENNELFSVGHLVGGNRLREEGNIKFRPESKWPGQYSKMKQILLFIGALPLMLINRYPLFRER